MLKKAFIILVIFLPLFTYNRVDAQSINGLTITPAILAIKQEAGTIQKYNFQIFSDTNKLVKLSVGLLTKDSNTSDPDINLNIAPELAAWFENLQAQIHIKKDVENDLEVSLNIPDYALGNYNFALVFNESSPEALDSINSTALSSNIAIPFILNITKEGEGFDENLSVSKYNIDPQITLNSQNTFDISLKNDGISYLIPRGVLSISPVHIIGSFQTQDQEINSKNQIIFRDSSFNLNTINNFEQNSFGQYKATLTVVYGLNNDIVTKEIYFWVIPPWLSVLIAVIILIALGLIIKKVYKLRLKNK